MNFHDMDYNQIRDIVYKNAIDKGFYDEGDPEIEERKQLVLTELAEASEAVRKAEPDIWFLCEITNSNGKEEGMVTLQEMELFKQPLTGKKPEGEAVEIADALIRLLDMSGRKEIDAEAMAEVSRPFAAADETAFTGRKPLSIHFSFSSIVTDANASLGSIVGCFIAYTESYFAFKGWDLKKTMQIKHEYNATRSYRHGNKTA